MINDSLVLSSLRKAFGRFVATDDVSLTVRHGEIHALIGPNGAGKSTLVNLASGSLRADSGKVSILGNDVTSLGPNRRAKGGLARSYQVTELFLPLTVVQNVKLAVQSRKDIKSRWWQNADRDPRLKAAAHEVLSEVDLDHRAQDQVASLSHGEKRQLEFAMCLAMNPKIVLLDEPMAGMGHEEGLKIMKLLQRHAARFGTLLIEHDMDAVFAIADRLTVLVQGRVIASGTVDEIRRNNEVRHAYLGDH